MKLTPTQQQRARALQRRIRDAIEAALAAGHPNDPRQTLIVMDAIAAVYAPLLWNAEPEALRYWAQAVAEHRGRLYANTPRRRQSA